jgi:hypothetical protein
MTTAHRDDGLDGRPEPAAAPAGSKAALKAALIFTALTVGLTWPQALRPASVPDHMDSYFNMWRLAWIAHQLPLDPRHLFDANIFHPLPLTLAFSDAILLQGLLAAPWIWAGVPVVFVSTALALGSFVACGMGVFLLTRDLTADAPAAVVAGLVFAFAPFRFDHYAHLELLWAQWMPLTLWMLHRVWRHGRLADGLWSGACFALQGLSCIYYTVFFAAALGGMMPLLWLDATPAQRRRAVRPLVAGLLLAGAVLVAYMAPYRSARALVGERDDGSVKLFSAGPAHYAAPMPTSVIYGASTAALGRHEKRLFPGVIAIALVGVALWPPIARRRLAYILLVALAVDGTLGHRGFVVPWLREHAALFRGLRVPARFGHLVLLGVSVLAGFGLARLRASLSTRRARLARMLPLVAGAVLTLEYLMWPMTLVPVQTAPDEASLWLRSQPPGVLADLPLPRVPSDLPGESLVGYRSTFHWRPMLNGYSGYTPATYLALWHPLASFPSPAAMTALRVRGVRYVAVREAGFGPARYEEIVRALRSRCDMDPAGPFSVGSSAVMMYTLQIGRPGCG